jgi:hypothetical protein
MPSLHDSMPTSLRAVAIIQVVLGSIEILAAATLGLLFMLKVLVSFGAGLLLGPVVLVPIAIWVISGALSLFSGFSALQGRPIPPRMKAASIMEIVCIIACCDVISLAGGITGLVLMNQPDSRAYIEKLRIN